MITIREQILSEIERYLQRSGVKLAETTFGRLACKDSMAVGRLRRGGTISIDKADAMRRFMRENPVWPPPKDDKRQEKASGHAASSAEAA